MAYNDQILRGDAPTYSDVPGAHPLIPEDVWDGIIKGATQKSTVLAMARKRRMARQVARMAVQATKPVAYFLAAEGARKQTTTMAWKNKFIVAAELAVIVPMTENLLDDLSFDIWGEIKPELEEAIGVAVDAAILLGVGKPTVWPTALAPTAETVGNIVDLGDTSPDIAADLNAVMGKVERDGFDVNGWIIETGMKETLRGLRDADRGFIFLQGMPGLENTVFKGSIYGERVTVPKNGVFESQNQAADRYMALAGDFTQLVVGIRQDVTYKILTEASLYDASGNLQFALAQDDMVALRVVMRLGFQVPNPLNRLNTSEGDPLVSGDRYPFAVLRNDIP